MVEGVLQLQVDPSQPKVNNGHVDHGVERARRMIWKDVAPQMEGEHDQKEKKWVYPRRELRRS